MFDQELYVVCQIDDFNLKIMVNKYVDNHIQVLYKEILNTEQYAENGLVLDSELTGKTLRTILNKINKLLKINITRVALNLPSNNLKIYQSRAMLDFKEVNHVITNSDINQVIEMAKNISIDRDEVICLTKPYDFKVDNKNFPNSFPLNAQGQIIYLESLIYTLPTAIYNSQLEVLKQAKCELLSATLDQFALVFNFHNNFNNLVLIDWGWNNTKISVFSNSALYAIHNIKIGFNQIIQGLMVKMHCSYSKALKYLTKIINVNSDYLGDLIVDKYFDQESRRMVVLSKADLQNTVRNQLDEIVEHIEGFLTEIINNDPNIEIAFTGQTINLPGFSSYIKNFEKLSKVSFIANIIPGIDNYEWAPLIGATNYQHNLNIFNNVTVSSISNTGKEIINKTLAHEKNEIDANQHHSHLNLNYQYNDNR
ncbi:Cell division protein FtsA [Spiroplasma sp. JKS002669]|uniref:hypothetical protein n=1 Tax=Spiroplasma attinicola TaxID=2904537 RepID=UPI0020C16C59|nr:hypothetical protein [Spiroplasma sp. JKS002669]MCL6428559.1 Cell division protein FtsA [Spiroplasma sp. JKS002669]